MQSVAIGVAGDRAHCDQPSRSLDSSELEYVRGRLSVLEKLAFIRYRSALDPHMW
ncbi:hypothetical protein [Nocardia sp. CA-119907]|uniref:hypothetical protein n=1 Tax=Nocardia sp. CA-119907 TaxID=3239973 RepID=UPI003D959B89